MNKFKYLASGSLLTVLLAASAFADSVIVRADRTVVGIVAARHGLKVAKELKSDGGLYLLSSTGAISPADLQTLKGDSLVQDASLNVKVGLPLGARGSGKVYLTTGAQRSLVDGPAVYSAQPAVADINVLPAQWAVRNLGNNVKVAVIDTWVDFRHTLLRNSIDRKNIYDAIANVGGKAITDQETTPFVDQETTPFVDQETTPFVDQETTPFVDAAGYVVILDQETTPFVDQETTPFVDKVGRAFGHGTMTASLVHLVAPGATLLPIRAFRNDGSGNIADVIQALYYARDKGVDVISMSFSVPDDGTNGDLAKAIGDVCTGQIICVASGSNSGTASPVLPASAPSVIGVAGTITGSLLKAPFSGFGMTLDVAAPATAIWGAYPGNHYARNDGVSFATALTSGAAALATAHNKAAAVEAALPKGTGPVNMGDHTVLRLDTFKAVQ